MQLSLAKSSTTAAETNIEVSEAVFAKQFNEPLIHQVITAYLAGARQGTHAQKNRSAVSGGGKKPWRQKGSGRARAGTIRSPLWRKGGVTFAASTQDYSQKVNRKMYRGAMCSILSELIRQERLLLVESFALATHKTRDLLAKLAEHNLTTNVLIVVDELDANLYYAAHNIPNVNVFDVAATDPVSLIKYEKVLMTVAALKQFEEMLA